MNPRTAKPDRVVLALVVALWLGVQLHAASPRDELLRYVPDDVGFCLVVQDLRARWSELSASPFAARFGKSAMGQAILQSQEWQHLQKVEQTLGKHVGLTWQTLRDDVLGDAFVFAYRPGPPGQPDQEQGLFLLRARNEKLLAGFFAKLNALQQGNGELKALDEREHRGVKYYRRQEAKATNYYLLRGPVLVFSAQESLLKQAIDRSQSEVGDSGLSVAKRLAELRLEQATIALALHPRAWDGILAAKATDPASQMAARCWLALQGVGLGVFADKDLRVQLSVRMKTADLPASARRFLAAAAQASELWGPIRDETLLAMGGRFDWSAMAEFLCESMSKTARQTAVAELDRTLGAILGKSVVKEVLPAVGPDWGVSVSAPPAKGKAWAPVVTVAVKVARGDESDPIDAALLAAVQSWAQLAILGHNKTYPERTLTLRSTILDRVRVRYLDGIGVFPEGVQPAFALKAGYLVLATSPAEIGRFQVGPIAAGDVPLVRLSLREWRAYLEQRREALATALAGKDGMTREKALTRIDELRNVLELFDRVEVRQAVRADAVSFTMTLTPSAPLRKSP